MDLQEDKCDDPILPENGENDKQDKAIQCVAHPKGEDILLVKSTQELVGFSRNQLFTILFLFLHNLTSI
jgi:hypothetical protein